MKIITSNNVICKFSPKMQPIERIVPGETIKVETNDCFYQQIISEEQVLHEIDFDRINPATGPIYVEGAEPGDLLQVKILSIDIKDKGIAAVIPGQGVLGDQVTNSVIKIVDIVDNHAVFNGIKLPVTPMIGVIGVAPAEEDGEWSTGSPWSHGGNMDTRDIKAGSTLYFPVRQEGALLALGDCHALMGDGEVCSTGLEIPASVTLEINLIKNMQVKWPLLETEDNTMIIASGDTLDDAAYEATDQTVKFIKHGLGFTWEDAYMLTSLAVDIKISQLVDPKNTVRSVIPKYVISTEKLIETI